MEFLKLYEEENKDILYSMSWINKNSNFDKSIGSFEEIDLFTFLENINNFNYEKDTFYDDVHYIFEYTEDSILHLINNINKEIKREHQILPISQAREFDKKTIMWLSRQDGRTIREKLKNNRIKTVKRYKDVDTYENRIFKIFLKKLILVDEARCEIQKNDHLTSKIRQWLRGDDAKNINEYGNIVYNNILLHHPHYSKIFKSYKWLNRLDEKVQKYQDLFPKQIIDILKFSILEKLQFKTNKLVLPNNIKIKHDEFYISFNEDCLPENINLADNITKLRIKTIDEVNFNNIVNLEQNIIGKQLNLELNEDRTFNIVQDDSKEVFIDLFRLFPIAKLDKDIITFPVMLKQQIDKKVVNGNNTKIINLNHEVYTLPEILKTYNTNILRYFLEDFKKYFKDVQLNYLIPDYVNVFEFSQVKKSINSYFPQNRNIPKSILAGLAPLLEGTIQENDTLIYIQKDHENDLYVTPLLVKYDKNLKSITNGLYLEKHPTKKLQEESDILDELNKSLNNKKLSQKLLNKFLQNGIKGIIKQKIAFYLDGNIKYLQNSKIISIEKNRIKQIKSLFHNKNLFKNEFIELKDKNKDNLYNFDKLLNYEKDGFTLWKEHLPRLAMQLPMKGYFGEFILVDENSEIINGNIKIENHFKIPSNTKELSFPLVFGDENINFEAYITSSEFPLKEDIECELELTYNYEAETPYKLTFIALDKTIKPLKVKWREIQYKECENLPIPAYPSKKTWEDFLKDPKRDNSGYSDLLEWIEERLDLLEINKVPQYIIEKEMKEVMQSYDSLKTGYFEWGRNDRNGNYYCRVNVNGESIFCHSSNFLENVNSNNLSEGQVIYLNVIQGKDGKIGKDIRFKPIDVNMLREKKVLQLESELKKQSIYTKTEKIFKGIKTLRYPLLTVWNEHSLSEYNVPNEFRDRMFFYIDLSLQLYNDSEVSDRLKNELFFVLSSLHQDMPHEISKELLNISSNLENEKKYFLNIALSLGSCELIWQKKILDNILSYINSARLQQELMNILSIASWRSEKFVSNLLKYDIDLIIEHLFLTLNVNIKNLDNNQKLAISNSVKQFELLLAIIRLRSKKSDLLCPGHTLTQKYIKIIDSANKYFIENQIRIKTRLKIELEKPEVFKDTSDILYALRVYLSGDDGAAKTIKILGVSDD
jgi:hypothetical protein